MKWRFDPIVLGTITLLCAWSAVDLAVAYAPQSAPSAVPVVNSVRFKAFNCPPLTPRQVESLVQTARERLPGIAAEPWFVYARRNHVRADGDTVVASVFMKPDERIGRVSKGWMVHVDTSIDVILAELGRTNGPASQPTSAPVAKEREVTSRPAKAPPAAARGTRYVHVAPQGASNVGDIPSDTDVPFEIPTGFDNVELVEIVDFVRELRRTSADNVGTETTPDDSKIIQMNGVDPTFPILRIVRAADRIAVWTGTNEGIVSGHGQRLDLTRDAAGKLVLRQVSIWYS